MRLRGCAIAALAAGLGAAFPTLAAAPPGWVIAGNAPTDYRFAVDTTTAASGKQSASISAKPGAKTNGFGTLMQIIAADNYRGDRLRLSGYLRTQAADRAQMWMRVDGAGGTILGFDNMDSRPVTGTTGWRRYDIVLDVPSDSVDIAFGFFLSGSGKVWGDDFELAKVESSVPVTSAGTALARAPANLDFEEPDSSQTGHWTARKLQVALPLDVPQNCDWLSDELKLVLLQLGARRSDLQVNTRLCYLNRPGLGGEVDATFAVLTPADTTGTDAASALVEGRWQSVDIRLDAMPRGDILTGSRINPIMPLPLQQFLVPLLKQKILPLFPIRSVELNDDHSMRVQVLKPQ